MWHVTVRLADGNWNYGVGETGFWVWREREGGGIGSGGAEEARGEIWGRMIGGRREGTRQVYPPSEAIVRREETGVAISEPPKGRRRE